MAHLRDNFSIPTKNALALRAGYCCSLCKRRTVGPSDESEVAVMRIGEAAHISAASPGPGARRFDSSIASEERAHISNGIWLCATCATIIDRDDVSYTSERLRQLKSEHEASCRLDNLNRPDSSEEHLVALGPNIIMTGGITGYRSEGLEFKISHLYKGDLHTILRYTSDFAQLPASQRFVLSNEIGDGRGVRGPIEFEKNGDTYRLFVPVMPRAERLSFDAIGASMDRENGRLIRGESVFIQMLQGSLSLAFGESPFHPSAGTHISAYYNDFADSHILDQLIKLETVRLASVPRRDVLQQTSTTPLRCVEKVIEMRADRCIVDHRINVHVSLQIASRGHWTQTIKIYIHDRAQLAEIEGREIPHFLRDLAREN